MKLNTVIILLSFAIVSCVPSGGDSKKKSKKSSSNSSSINADGNAGGSGLGSTSTGVEVDNCAYPSLGSNMQVKQMNGTTQNISSGAAYMLGSHTSNNDVVNLGARVSVIVDNKVDKIILPNAKSKYGFGKKPDGVHFAIFDNTCPGNPIVVDFQSVKDNVLVQFAGSSLSFPLTQDFSAGVFRFDNAAY